MFITAAQSKTLLCNQQTSPTIMQFQDKLDLMSYPEVHANSLSLIRPGPEEDKQPTQPMHHL